MLSRRAGLTTNWRSIYEKTSAFVMRFSNFFNPLKVETTSAPNSPFSQHCVLPRTLHLHHVPPVLATESLDVIDKARGN